MVFVWNFCKKRPIGYQNPILGKLGVTRNLDWWIAGKPVVNFLFALIELFFSIYYGSGAMRRNVYSSAVFTGDRPLCTQTLPRQGRRLSTILSIRKLEALGYPKVKAVSLCVPSFWHNTRVWRTDGHTDAYAAQHIQPLAKLALRCAVKLQLTIKSHISRFAFTLHAGFNWSTWPACTGHSVSNSIKRCSFQTTVVQLSIFVVVIIRPQQEWLHCNNSVLLLVRSCVSLVSEPHVSASQSVHHIRIVHRIIRRYTSVLVQWHDPTFFKKACSVY